MVLEDRIQEDEWQSSGVTEGGAEAQVPLLLRSRRSIQQIGHYLADSKSHEDLGDSSKWEYGHDGSAGSQLRHGSDDVHE